MNGTTNFILSKMESEGADYQDVLQQAQVIVRLSLCLSSVTSIRCLATQKLIPPQMLKDTMFKLVLPLPILAWPHSLSLSVSLASILRPK
jgi:hypothetical protein